MVYYIWLHNHKTAISMASMNLDRVKQLNQKYHTRTDCYGDLKMKKKKKHWTHTHEMNQMLFEIKAEEVRDI